MVAACSSDPGTTNPPGGRPALTQPVPGAPPPTSESGAQLAARVNGVEITLAQFERELQRRQQQSNAASTDTLRQEVLDQLIADVLVIQGAQARNIVVNDAQLQSEWQSYIDQAGSQQAFEEWLAANLFTPDEFRESLRVPMVFNQVRDALNADLAGNVPQAHARHVLARTEADANAALGLLNKGQDFAAVAQSFSVDETTRDQGGDLGWFTRDELLVPELAEATFALQPGQIAGPIATDLGYHVVQLLEIAERPVGEDRRVYIAQSRFEAWLRMLYEQAVIERYAG
jgi:parvulin-like peptidyl-prolyl isomerase